MLGLTSRLAREVGPRGVRVNAVAPGLFLTGRLQQMYDDMPAAERHEVLDAIPLGRFPELREIVEPDLVPRLGRGVLHTGVSSTSTAGASCPQGRVPWKPARCSSVHGLEPSPSGSAWFDGAFVPLATPRSPRVTSKP